MNALRSGLYSGAATAAKLLAALVALKLVAASAGPAGVGRLGQFTALMSLLAVLAGGGIGAGIVKYVAEYRQDPARLARLLGAALGYAGCAATLMAVAALLARRALAERLLGDAHYQGLIGGLALVQVVIALGNYALAVVNGFLDVRRLAFVQIAAALAGIALVAVLAWWRQLDGALLGLALGQVLLAVLALAALRRSPYFVATMLRPRMDPEMTRRLAAFSTMTLTSALLPSLVGVLVRDHLAVRFGWQQVGYWQAVSRVSDAYLLFLTTAINVYYLPKLSALSTRAGLARELKAAYRYLLPLVLLLAGAIWLCRDAVTRLLFDAGFLAALPLYAPQLVGDVVKIAAFALSYLMLAKSMTRLFVLSECVFAASYLGLVYLFTARFGLVGAMYAFVANYVLYLLFNLAVVRHHLRGLA